MAQNNYQKEIERLTDLSVGTIYVAEDDCTYHSSVAAESEYEGYDPSYYDYN